MAVIDETHDPTLESWVEPANFSQDFPIQNLPLATFLYEGQQRIGAGIGDAVLDLAPWLPGRDLSSFFRSGELDRRQLRRDLSRALRKGSTPRQLYSQSECTFLLPCVIGDYTDFYASIHHARNVGALFRPENPLLPNYRHMPIAYHGRASSIVISGTPIRRPCGQLGEGLFGASAELDYEVEIGAFIGPGNAIGESVPLARASEQVAGYCLLNDWSARDIQRWEYQPLGPFLAKNFATTISPWVVTAEALAPFAVNAPAEDRVELKYLRHGADETAAFNICIEAFLKPASSSDEVRLSSANFRHMYWTWAQMVAHHTVNGCPLRPGDLLGSGTISGPEPENRGCLLELTEKGRRPIALPNGHKRVFLEDGDQVTLRAFCERSGYRRIGFGRCAGRII
ncbi:MAG TPA: fumarylacetoacetase [Bryobacteraceae bacterium]|jgi:fumarylacetoacetase|nr:fumarylacetoacetase [Bryobacteraceae bacterium]